MKSFISPYSAKRYRFRSIFSRNLTMTCVILIIPLMIMSNLFYRYLQDIASQDIEQNNIDQAARIGAQLESMYSDLSTSMFSLGVHPDVENFLLNTSVFATDSSSYIARIQTLMRNIKIGKGYITGISLYSAHSGRVLSTSTTTELFDKDFLSQSDFAYPYNEFSIIPRTEINYPHTVSILLPLLDNPTSLKGVIIVNLDYECIGNILLPLDEARSLYIFSDQDTVLFSESRDEIFLSLPELLEAKELPGLMPDDQDASKPTERPAIYKGNAWSFYLAYYGNTAHYQAALANVRTQSIRLTLLISFISFIIAFLISYKSYQPIHTIVSALTDSNKPTNITPQSMTELKYILQTIMNSKAHTAMLTLELDKRLELLNEAQSATFQAQITPHFMYNTLDTFKWQAMELSGGRNELSKSIGVFSKLLRISIDGTEKVVPLSVELEHARLYLDILNLRYADKFDVVWELPDECLSFVLPKLSLQPIIENAIYHGIKPQKGKCTLTISAKCTDNHLLLTVQDNGVGIPPEILQELRENINNLDFVTAQHVGIRNVNQRTKLIFGEQYGISLDSMIGHGTRVTLCLPCTF